jgi:adenosylmethionine-8-amino-7-oxononanoate aminotransferase
MTSPGQFSSSVLALTAEEIVRLDQQHVWHPYAAMPNSIPCLPVQSAKGCEIHLTDGRTLIDGMSSWWACIHGYSHPHLVQAAKDQIDNMSHVMFGGLTHEPAVKLASELSKIVPGEGDSKLDKIFYCDSGSVAIEVAMKMALQYWYNLDNPQKSKFLTIRGGYHGDTFEAMSVCDPVNGMHHIFSSVLPEQIFCSRPTIKFDEPWDESDIEELKSLLGSRSEVIAALILEPIVQGAGGMRFYSPHYLRRVRELCDEHNVLLICDEIATGFGRTGTIFAVEHASIVPDIMCIGKALSGGFVSFAATLTNERIAQVFARGPAGVLMHGPTFMGSPLACAVSLASLQLLQSYQLPNMVGAIQAQLEKELEPARDSPLVEDVRCLGGIGVIEMKEPMDMKTIQPAIVDEGVWLRPFGKLLYTMPPLIIQPHELRKITRGMLKIVFRGKAG